MPVHQGYQVPGPGHRAPSSPAILGVKGDHGESEMKVRDVLVKVFEPGRLQMAWQQVRKNAGAAGIDQMTVEEFAQREEPLLALIHDKLKSGSYRFPTGQTGANPEGRDIQDEETGDTGGDGPDRGCQYAQRTGRDLRSGLYRIQLWLPQGKEPASGHTASTEAGERRERMGGCGRLEVVL